MGAVLYRRLLERFESPERVFQTGLAGVCRPSKGLAKNTALAIVDFRGDEAIDRELEALERQGSAVLTRKIRIILRFWPRFMIRPRFFITRETGALEISRR